MFIIISPNNRSRLIIVTLIMLIIRIPIGRMIKGSLFEKRKIQAFPGKPFPVKEKLLFCAAECIFIPFFV